jgi:very-short-patch-repair endonuclease
VPESARVGSGVFTARDALAGVMTPAQVRWRVETKRWTRIGNLLCAGPATVYQRAHAAACTWPGAIVCLTTAALLHRLPVPDDGLAHVAVSSGRPRRGVLVPHEQALDQDEICRVGLVPATTRSRAIIDCLGLMPRHDSERLLAWVASRQLLSADELARWIADHPGARGNAQRRTAERRLRTGAVNPAEERLHAALRAARLTGWSANVPMLARFGVAAAADVFFEDVLLVVEIDGKEAHAARFQSDRDRQNLLVAAGCTVLRFTWDDVSRRPAHVAAQIARVVDDLRARRLDLYRT